MPITLPTDRAGDASVRYDDNLTTERPTFVSHLECAMTGERYPADEIHNLSRAGKPLLVRYDLDGVKKSLSKDALANRPPDLWRYRELLPVRRKEDIVSLGEAMTPLCRCGNSRPSSRAANSGKGRGSAADRLVQSPRPGDGRVDGEGARHQAPGDADQRQCRRGACRLRQPRRHRVLDLLSRGHARGECQRDRTARRHGLSGQRPDRRLRQDRPRGKAKVGWFDVSTLKEPYRIEGKKTMGLELAEQLGWTVPDVIFYPTGGGTGLIGMWKAFAELEAIGFIGSKRPRMVAVQAAGCAPIVHAYEQGVEHATRVTRPYHRLRHPRAAGDRRLSDPACGAREQGFAIAVSDEAITAALEEIAREEGFLMCPEGAATYAAYKESLADGRVPPTKQAVLFNCATGLKYPLPPIHRALDRHKPIDFAAL